MLSKPCFSWRSLGTAHADGSAKQRAIGMLEATNQPFQNQHVTRGKKDGRECDFTRVRYFYAMQEAVFRLEDYQ